ncbi:MAG TPA: alcohol dehydrogenase, partial [candidate division Zixibacteria bacterium]|nr:alcohol dehydrogenase [candidate division Zixibacteria bacterium]
TEPKKNLIPGHEIVGTVMKTGKNVKDFKVGDKIGVPWLGYSCGKCAFCKKGKENLCDNPGFTGYTIDGGYAEYTVADQRYCFNIPDGYDNYKAAPLLCAGLIGYRSYRMCGSDFETLGIYGFGGAAHIIAQIAAYQGKKVYAFTRPGDKQAQDFSFRLGAVWAGDSTEPPPELLDAAIIFAPVGSLVPAAMKAVVKGGVIVCGGIYMSNIPEFPYSLLWEERQLISVANLTRQDGDELMAIAPKVPVETEVTLFPLEQANEALERLRSGNIEGAAVLKME